MFIVRSALTLVVLLIITALAASPATAEPTPLDTVVEPTGTCPEITVTDHAVSGGCEMHVVSLGDMVLTTHETGVGETVSARCDSEFTARIHGWEGYLTSQFLSGAECPLAPCREGDSVSPKEPWHFEMEETGPGTEHVTLETCLSPILLPNTKIRCYAEYDLIDMGGHGYQIEADDTPCVNLLGAVESSGYWMFEDTSVEIFHP
jgi:hypothetical protein